MSKSTRIPVISVNEIKDEVVRKNFQNMLDYFERTSNFQEFQFLEFETEKAQNNLKVAHGLGFIPKDAVITAESVAGTTTLNTDKFDAQNLDVTTSGAVKVRLFVGSQRL